MRAERDKRAAILHAEGNRQAKILEADGTRQQSILEAQGDQEAAVLRAEGEAQAINLVFQAVHHNDADPKLLAYKYLETLPQLAAGDNNTMWVVPGEFTKALESVTQAFAGRAADRPTGESAAPDAELSTAHSPPAVTDGGSLPRLEHSTDHATEMAQAAVSDAKAEAAAAERGTPPSPPSVGEPPAVD